MKVPANRLGSPFLRARYATSMYTRTIGEERQTIFANVSTLFLPAEGTRSYIRLTKNLFF
jgi:hypothetical protein